MTYTLRITLIAIALIVSPAHVGDVISQEIQAEQSESPIANSEFYDVKTRTRVTQRFEIYDPRSVADLKTVKAMGFTQVILDQPQWHVHATELGLDVVLANWWTKDSPQELYDQTFRIAKEVAPKNLVGISIMDEPELNSPDTPFPFYGDLYKRLRHRLAEGLGHVKLEISYWGPLRTWNQSKYDNFSLLYQSADVIRIMPYPDLKEGPLREVYLMLQRSKRAMSIAKVDIPHVVILQAWVLPPENKLPTIDELRVMAYQAMLGGTETLSFFEYKPEVWEKTKSFTEDFQGLMRELRALSQRLSGALIESVLLENGILESTATWPTGRTHKIRVNTNRFEQGDLKGLQIQDSSLLTQSPAPSVAQLGSDHRQDFLPLRISHPCDILPTRYYPLPTQSTCPVICQPVLQQPCRTFRPFLGRRL
ncbi:MAG: hypothetical protein ABL921_11985 [Pirellula sp.]